MIDGGSYRLSTDIGEKFKVQLSIISIQTLTMFNSKHDITSLPQPSSNQQQQHRLKRIEQFNKLSGHGEMTGTPPSEKEEKDEEKDQDENNTNAGQENQQQSEDLRIWNQIQDFTDIPEDPGLTAHPELYNTTTAT
jgi:hypothetical protein